MSRSSLALEAAILLFLCAASAGISLISLEGAFTLATAGLVLTIPACATLVFLVLAATVPNLVGANGMRPPFNWTLPVVYASLLVGSVTLLSRVGVSIRRFPPDFWALTVWSNLWLDLLVMATGVIVLSMAVRRTPVER